MKLPMHKASRPRLHGRKLSAGGHSAYGKMPAFHPSAGGGMPGGGDGMPSAGLGTGAGASGASAFGTPQAPNAAAFMPPGGGGQ